LAASHLTKRVMVGHLDSIPRLLRRALNEFHESGNVAMVGFRHFE
jgi:hypothetical protein